MNEMINACIPVKFKQICKRFIKEEGSYLTQKDQTNESWDLIEKLYLSSEDMKRSYDLLKSRDSGKINSIIWLIPGFRHPFGGIFTILRFMDYFKSLGFENKLIIYDNFGLFTESSIKETNRYFTGISLHDFTIIKNSLPREVPESDIAIATYWTSCYQLMQIRNTRKKFYFIQDFEPLFYAAGTKYGLCENTYYFPFHKIINSKGLFDHINNNYKVEGTKSMYFSPGVDDRYKYEEKSIDGKIRVFFYARPNSERNAFLLGLNFLSKIKEKYGDRLEIVCAGQSFDVKYFGLEKISNYIVIEGTISYENLPVFYNTFHVGISFMFTKHPSYIPLELMKSGCLVFTNYNPSNLWLFKDGHNCIMCLPSVSLMLERFSSLINEPDAYLDIIRNAYKTVTEFKWDAALNKTINFIKNV